MSTRAATSLEWVKGSGVQTGAEARVAAAQAVGSEEEATVAGSATAARTVVMVEEAARSSLPITPTPELKPIPARGSRAG